MKIYRFIIILVLSGIVVSPSLASGNAPKPTSSTVQPSQPTIITKATPLSWDSNTIADIVDKVGPGVVNIDVVKKVRVSSPFNSFGNDFFFDFMPS